MKRIHYSTKPLVKINGMRQKQKADGKPVGLWYSMPGEDGWAEWCRSAEFHLDSLAVETELKVDPSGMLVLTSLDELDTFHDAYSVPLTPGVCPHNIDWPRVAEEYAGIEISPYQWERRLEPGWLWYYGWDCASGCVWDAGAVEIIRSVTTV
jgi:hypothetical protein